jgi:hypothetical protein
MGPCEASPLLRNSGLAVPSDRPSPTKTPGLSDTRLDHQRLSAHVEVEVISHSPRRCSPGLVDQVQMKRAAVARFIIQVAKTDSSLDVATLRNKAVAAFSARSSSRSLMLLEMA